jgi:type II secretory pathway predicted ATPase ExeA
MIKMQQKALAKKLERLDYPEFEVKPGREEVAMLYIASRLICAVSHALELPDEKLHALIEETLQYGG